MVRFSDIIKVKNKKVSKTSPKGKSIQEDKIRFSDSQIFKTVHEKRDEDQAFTETSLRHNTGIEVVSYYEKFIEKASDVQERVKGDKGISPSPVLSDLHFIIDKDLIDELYEYSMSTRQDYEDMLIHTINVTFTSLKLGKGMDYDIKMLLRLGLAAFLENVGMYKIPDNILKSTSKLGETEIKVIRKHPQVSYEILGQMGERYSWLADVALQVHERADGSGYPSGLKGGEILELASIIGLVDTYVAMIKNRPYREKFIQTHAIKSIVEAGKKLFPPKIVKTFLNQVSLFPVNSYVKLNNGSIGRVISTDKNQPLRPTIELLYDGMGNKLDKIRVIRLSDDPLLYIDSSTSEKELL